ncbi:hypothetical protein AQV86_02770 [Nanohaloarchaea archaeon SG9]|nr:hypothetical protein AQV86_02770 [Nanohaloarchaea archaeon SG9]
MLEPVIQQLSNFFLNPLGLAALLGLVPLVIFYLVRPSPEEKVMPSMKFFQKDKKSGRLQKALKVLQRNMMLLLHVLMVAGLAAGIANPYIMGEQRPENAVIVIDNSASMKPVFDQVKQEATSQAGRSNTVIVANDETEIALEKASLSETQRFIRGLEVEETGTNIVRAVQRAGNYEGKVFLATDFQQTAETDTDIKDLVKTVSTSRPLQTFDPTKSNEWGIVDLEIDGENATAFIQNFRDQRASINVEVGDGSRSLDLKAGELRRLSFTLQKGKNTLSLEEDGFEIDNTARIYRPSDDDTRVAVVDNEKNRYLMKALDLVENVDPVYVRPSESLPRSDVYILGRMDSLQEVDTQKMVSELKQGKGLVLYAQSGAEDISSELPVSSTGEAFNSSVEVSEPVEIETGNISLLESAVDGESVSTPKEALQFADVGDGEFVYFNFGSQEFRESLDYPVFWKQVVERAAGRPSAQDLNLETGSTVLAEEKTIEITETGFQELDGKMYASNLLNGEESRFESFEIEHSSAEAVKQPQSFQALPVLLIIVLGLFEMAYLYRRGEIP